MDETTKCPYCQKDISSLATKCPYCQSKIRQKTRPVFWAFIIILGFLVVVGIINATGSGNDSANTASVITPNLQAQPSTSSPVQTNATSSKPVDNGNGAAGAALAKWHTAYTYSNNTLVHTAPFSMTGARWRITYSCTPQDSSVGLSFFQGYLDSADTGATVDGGVFANDTDCPTKHTSYLYGQTAGQYYLDVGSTNATYSVTIEDYY